MKPNSPTIPARPIITIDEMINSTSYKLNAKQYKCRLCKHILLNPMMCSQCESVFCRNCIFPYVLKYNTCPFGCDNFDLNNADYAHDNEFSKFEIICKICENVFPITTYQTHYNKCSIQNNDNICWNCNTKVLNKEMQFLSYNEYIHLYKYNKVINLEDDKPFLIYISTNKSNVNGYITLNESYLVCFHNRYSAAVFSEVVIEGMSYIKVFDNLKWKFLKGSYKEGVVYGSWNDCSSIRIDHKNKEMVCNEGLFVKNNKLVVRERDGKLFFYESNDKYLECVVNVIYLN